MHSNQRILVQSTPLPFEGFTIGGQEILELAGGSLAPPLVTFIIINWNYARYVGAAIDSIRRQDYPHFECLVIDNGSTDDSAAVIARHVADDHRFAVFTLPDNLGQLGAAFWAFDKVKGGFVTFVDSDDILFRNYASTHVQAHMALTQTVAFTSSNATEMDAEGHALTSSSLRSASKKARPVSGLLSRNSVLRLPAISAEDYDFLSANVSLVPRNEGGWVWGSGSSNMYRTSILRMVRLGDGTKHHMRSADGYFNIVGQALAGSALIHMHLSAYRLHGKNYFAAREKIPDFRSGTRQYAGESAASVFDGLEHFLSGAETFGWTLGKAYFPVLDQITRAGPAKYRLRRFYRNKRAFRLFAEHAPRLKAAFGPLKFAINIASRFSPKRAGQIFLAGFRGISHTSGG